jgi:3D (Asp-Asp-Asp) domain-containing protein
MTLYQKNNALQKIVDLTLVAIVGLSLISSMSAPSIAKAETLPPQTDPAPFADEIPPTPEYTVVRTIGTVATAYSSDVGQTDSTPCIPAMSKFNLCENFAATGIEDTIAANFLPLGTKVRFPDTYGDQIFVVRDRMNSKYNGQYRIDFWKSNRTSAVHFGVQRVKMEVLK